MSAALLHNIQLASDALQPCEITGSHNEARPHKVRVIDHKARDLGASRRTNWILTGIETTFIPLLSLASRERDMRFAGAGSAPTHTTTVRGGVGFVSAEEENFWPRPGRVDPV